MKYPFPRNRTPGERVTEHERHYLSIDEQANLVRHPDSGYMFAKADPCPACRSNDVEWYGFRGDPSPRKFVNSQDYTCYRCCSCGHEGPAVRGDDRTDAYNRWNAAARGEQATDDFNREYAEYRR